MADVPLSETGRAARTHRLAPGFEVTTLESLDPSFGSYTWPSAAVLAHWCLRFRARVAGRSVLELGAGTGLAGLACSRCGAVEVVLSDSGSLPDVLENLRQTAAAAAAAAAEQGAAACPVRVAAVSWGQFSPDVLALDPPDLILAADCLYDSKDFDAFFATATFLMRKRRRKLGERGGPAVLVTAYQHRSGHRCLEWLLDRWGLEVTAVTPAEDVIPPDATPPREMIEIIELQLRAEEGTGAAVGNAEDCS